MSHQPDSPREARGADAFGAHDAHASAGTRRRTEGLVSFGFVGLAFLRVWLQVCLYGTYTLSDNGQVSIVSNFAYAAMILAGAIWAFACNPPLEGKAARSIPWIAFVLMTLSCVGLLAARMTGNEEALLIASIVAGAAAPFGGAMWVVAYVRLELRPAVMWSLISLGIGSLAGYVLSFMPEVTRLYVAMLMPACMLVCHRYALDATFGADSKASVRWFDGEPVSTPVILLAGISLLAIALGITRGYPSGDPVPMSAGMRALHQLGVFAVSAALLWLIAVRGRIPSASVLVGLDIAVIAAGILIASIPDRGLTGYGVALSNLGDTLMLGFLWIFSIDYARHTSRSPIAVVGIAWFARIFFRDVSRVVMPAVAARFAVGVDVIAGVVVFALAAGMAALLSGVVPRNARLISEQQDQGRSLEKNGVFSQRGTLARAAGDGPDSGPGGGADASQQVAGYAASAGQESLSISSASLLSARVASLQMDCGLTEREAQVCALIASGRNKTAIADYLGVSENTVRTHSKNAYAKLGVHSKEELVALLEREDAGDSGLQPR